MKLIKYIMDMIKEKVGKKRRTYNKVHPEIMYVINKPFAKYIPFEEV